jgi:hypothetical protein
MMKRKHTVLLSAVMLFVFSTAFSAQARELGRLDESKFYTSHNAHEHLGTIDLYSAAGSDVGPYEHRDLDITRTGWPAANGAIYRNYFYTILNRRIPLDEDPPHIEARLARVNPLTGKVKLLGSPIPLNLVGLEISHCGEVYATGFSLTNPLGHWYGDKNLYRIDIQDATMTLVGYTGIERIMDLAFDPEGNLWATVGNVLYTLNIETGAPTAVSTITGVDEDHEIMGIGFTSDGELFGTTPFSDGLYSIDPDSGVATKVGNHGLVIPHGGDIPMTPYDTCCPKHDDSTSAAPAKQRGLSSKGKLSAVWGRLKAR